MTRPVLVLLGSTASGKEAAAIAAARSLGAEIACADSVKPYRGLEIASSAPDATARAVVPHHLVGVLDPRERLSAGRWARLAGEVLADCDARRVPLLFVGGTALYLRALLFGLFEGPPAVREVADRLRAEEATAPGTLHARLGALDPAAAAKLHRNDVKRLARALEVLETTGRRISEIQREWAGPPRRPYVAVGIRRSREDLRARIERRVLRMVRQGLVGEVRALVASDALGPTASEAIGVKEFLPVLRHEQEPGARNEAAHGAAIDAALALVRRNTWALVRRQDTWWRRFPGVTWLDVSAEESAEETGRRVASHFGRALASPGSE